MAKGILVFIAGLSLAGVAAETRAPATVPTSNGVVCGQGRAITEAEEKLNDKLSSSGEVVASMVKRYGKIKNPKTTGVSVSVVPDPSNPGILNYIVCVSISGDQT